MNGTGSVVLVVEDHADLRRAVAELLSCCGYDVVEACHGREGIARLCEHVPDLVILDLNMPIMDGWEFRAEQRRLPDRRLAKIPVLLLTAADGADTHVAALDAVGIIEKPFLPDHLIGAIETALGR